MKRLLDFVLAAVLFVFLLPLLLIIGMLVRVNLGSPILFKQQRPGLNGKPFFLYKFRSMNNQKDSLGQLLPDQLRLTAFGQFIRKYSLDEWPQLINVIKGDLSLVGPRPLLMEYLPLYTKEQWKRHNVRPGLTGWAQVNGRNLIDWEEKFNLDIWYVHNQSFWLDIKILFLTLLKVLKTEGINQHGSMTMKRFKGSNQNVKEEHI